MTVEIHETTVKRGDTDYDVQLVLGDSTDATSAQILVQILVRSVGAENDQLSQIQKAALKKVHAAIGRMIQ